MNLINYKASDIPMKDMETLGLAYNGELLLKVDDLKALLSGKRTDLIELENLEADHLRIASVFAKLSLKPNEQGKLDLLIHPIYRNPKIPEGLEQEEARQLIENKTGSIRKFTTSDKGGKKELLFEYDRQTREFMISDTERILAPDMVNGEFLTASQKEDFKKGREVELPDRTRFSYSATDKHGIRSNRIALVASVLIDGGLSYVLYQGLNRLFNQKQPPGERSDNLSPAYYNALKDMQAQEHIQPALPTRGYTRGGNAR